MENELCARCGLPLYSRIHTVEAAMYDSESCLFVSPNYPHDRVIRLTMLDVLRNHAQERADETGSSVLVYRSLLKPDGEPEYAIDYTLPLFGQRIGERIYPQKKLNSAQ